MHKGLIIVATGGLLAVLLWAGCKSTRAGYESPKYRVVDKDGKFEIRDYPALVVAETSMGADGKGMNDGFNKLFRFITGGNSKTEKIPGSTRKQPMCIGLKDQEPFVFAGLWDTWKKPDDTDIESYTIITCEPNDLMRPIHNRMPVILKPENYDQWLDPKYEDVDELTKMLSPYPEAAMAAHQVSTLVNNPKFDDPRCIEPVK